MATKLGTPIADFTTQLATALEISGTTASLQSATDDDGVALPAGRYFFTIDNANSAKEHISCDLSGTSLTNIKSISRQGVETTGAARKHRIGASVTITDFATIRFVSDLIAGLTALDANHILTYDANITPTLDNQLVTKKYVDDVVVAGAPDAATGTKGVTKVSVAPASSTNPIAVGTNDPRIFPNGYAADAGSTDAYAITLGVSPGAYAAGQVYAFKANTVNTGAATLNVNSIGAVTIKKKGNLDLDTGDILAGSIHAVIYDGTNFQLLSPTVQKAPVVNVYTSNATWTKPAGLAYVIVEVQASGGGGGGADASSSNESYAGAGGSGGYSKKLIAASALGSTEAVVVGTGGAGGSSSGGNGSDGNTSSFGSIITTGGGQHGNGDDTNSASGDGGSASGGDINISGQPGTRGGYTTESGVWQPAYGGKSMFSQGYGRGGDGAFSSNGSESGGQAGTDGVVIVTEYY